MGLAENVARITENRVYRDVMVVKLIVTSPLGRPSRILKDNITTYLEELGLGHGLD